MRNKKGFIKRMSIIVLIMLVVGLAIYFAPKNNITGKAVGEGFKTLTGYASSDYDSYAKIDDYKVWVCNNKPYLCSNKEKNKIRKPYSKTDWERLRKEYNDYAKTNNKQIPTEKGAKSTDEGKAEGDFYPYLPPSSASEKKKDRTDKGQALEYPAGKKMNKYKDLGYRYDAVTEDEDLAKKLKYYDIPAQDVVYTEGPNKGKINEEKATQALANKKQELMNQGLNNLRTKGRGKLQGVFSTLFDNWLMEAGLFGISRVAPAQWCGLAPYIDETQHQDMLGFQVPSYTTGSAWEDQLTGGRRVVSIEGEKEEIVPGQKYRYAFTVRLVGGSGEAITGMRGGAPERLSYEEPGADFTIYLYNSCTGEISFPTYATSAEYTNAIPFYDYGSLSTGQNFIRHYAGGEGEDMIFEKNADPHYRFDMACVYFTIEGTAEERYQPNPYCEKLSNGPHGTMFETPNDKLDYERYDC